MNISYNWIREFVNTNLAPRELGERLTMLGMAVEGVHDAGDDSVLDIDLTSNRPDCLSHVGVAREIAAMEGTQVRLPEAKPSRVGGRADEATSVQILDADLCPRYAARVVRDVKIQPSPEWLATRLKAIGQRPINNVADITNYVLHEMGQPLHAFDLVKLSEQKIIVRRALNNEKLTTLDGIKRDLDSEMLVIADADRAVALAGIMGGEDSEISDSTSDVLIESAYFDPSSVRRTARKLGMHTEASHRFERGVDYANVLRAQERCVALICEVAGGTATEDAIDVYPRPRIQPIVKLRPERVEALTGLKVSEKDIIRILMALGFALSPEQQSGKLSFVVPTWRVDVEIEEDLVEEVARHTGYEKIATELPASSVAGEYHPNEIKKRSLSNALTACGYDEAIDFSFIETTHDGEFELLPELAAQTQAENRAVTLQNPITEGVTRMRATLLPGLLSAVRNNFNHGTTDLRLFEKGRVFAPAPGEGELPLERESLALVATGGAIEENRAGATRELEFFDLKGALETAVDALNIPALEFEAVSARHLREGQAATIRLNNRKQVGYIGRLADSIATENKFRQPVFVAEIDLTELLEAPETQILFKPLARYPSVGRDISLLVARTTSFAQLVHAVSEQKEALCRGAELVGVYEGPNLPADKRSVTLRLEYRADDHTLRDEEVDEIHGRIVTALEEKMDARLRV